MKPKATKGPCGHCGKEYTRAGMAKHLAKCLLDEARTTNGKKAKPCFHLQVAAKFSSAYWLHLQTDGDSTLKTLDKFLRDIWLECCGHMSLFHVGHQKIGMGRKLSALFSPGMAIEYDYDMGDTTSLEIKVMGVYQGLVSPGKPVEILARNQQPEIACDSCGKALAVQICPECQWDDEGWLCKACAAKHECGDDEYFLPVVNSPRTGVCGYVG